MKRKLKIFVIYFPIILVSAQVAVNLLYFIAPKIYMHTGFYLNTFFGTNALFAIFLLIFTYTFRFCDVSKSAAWAEVLFALNYLIVRQDNLYNIMFQVIVGSLAVALTFRQYIKMFPLCRLSLIIKFYKSLISAKGDCERAFIKWEQDLKTTIIRNHAKRRS